VARTDAPGLQWRPRKTGERVAYWYARPDLIKRGYTPKAVRLHYDASNPAGMAALASRCQRLQAEMLAWANPQQVNPVYDGKLETLIRLYETDGQSPYRDLKQLTQTTYSKILGYFLERVEGAYINELTGADVKRWFRRMCERGSVGYASLTISVIKTVVSYGMSLGFEDCAKLRGQMTATRFKTGTPRKERLTYAQVVAFREAAHRRGRPSAALWLTLQLRAFVASSRRHRRVGRRRAWR
jgi:hypothetical protein